MKHLLIILAFVLLCSGLIGQKNTTDIYAGFLSPADTDAGFQCGIDWNTRFDDHVSLGFGASFFTTGYTDDKKIGGYDTAGTNVSTVKRTTDIGIYYLPVMGKLRVTFPRPDTITPFVEAGLGYGFLWESVFIGKKVDDNGVTTEKVDEVNAYNGFNWMLGAGAKIKLGERSNLYAEAIYNGGAMTSGKDVSDEGITWDEVDMSGLGLRLGIELLTY